MELATDITYLALVSGLLASTWAVTAVFSVVGVHVTTR